MSVENSRQKRVGAQKYAVSRSATFGIMKTKHVVSNRKMCFVKTGILSMATINLFLNKSIYAGNAPNAK